MNGLVGVAGRAASPGRLGAGATTGKPHAD